MCQNNIDIKPLIQLKQKTGRKYDSIDHPLFILFFFSGFPDKLRSFPCKAHPLPSLKKQKNANDFVEIGVEKDKFECQRDMIGSKWTNFFFFFLRNKSTTYHYLEHLQQWS